MLAAGLRNGQWGRRGVMRALGVWHDGADAVAPSSWLSVRSERLLVVEGPFIANFGSMAEFDRTLCRCDRNPRRRRRRSSRLLHTDATNTKAFTN